MGVVWWRSTKERGDRGQDQLPKIIALTQCHETDALLVLNQIQDKMWKINDGIP